MKATKNTRQGSPAAARPDGHAPAGEAAEPAALRLFNAIGGSWKAVGRTVVLLGVVGVGLTFMPMNIELGPVSITHVEDRCLPPMEAPTTLAPAPVTPSQTTAVAAPATEQPIL